MILDTELTCLPQQRDDEAAHKKLASAKLNIPQGSINAITLVKKSIDARGKVVLYRLQIKVYIDEYPAIKNFSAYYQNVTDKKPVIIVGAGPAGLFAALRCIELGLKPVLLERGKNVKDRRRDLAILNRQGIVNPDSNYCFGEGGAGTYSDGKLYTRSTKRGNVQQVLQTLVNHGAPADILIDARPHIGTNKLPQIITAIKNTILNAGGEIHFETRVTGFDIRFNKIYGVKTASEETVEAEAVILATGHSAHDVYEMLHQQNILIEAKPFALGVRIEHPQEIIDQSQYHCESRGAWLPPSYYSLVDQVDGRGVFSFCMCPGGIIAPCATKPGEIVVNGWSPSKRNNPFANSGTVVQISLEDVPGKSDDPFRLLKFQHQAEEKAFFAGGGNQVAPAQRMIDFVNGNISADLPQNSYLPGLKSTNLQEVLPQFVFYRLKEALPRFGKKMKGYYTNEAVLVGVESRTSSAVKIPRDKITLQHPQITGLFPCGEGAGYAGGIISAAIDGINCAEAIQS